MFASPWKLCTRNIQSVFELNIREYQAAPDGAVAVNVLVVFGDVATELVVVGSKE